MARGLLSIIVVFALGCGAGPSQPESAAGPSGERANPAAVREFQAGVRRMESGGRSAERRARQHFETALETDPNLWEAHYNLGVLDRRAHAFRDAANHFELARAGAPGNREVLIALAEARHSLGEDQSAASLLSTYVETHPDDLDARVALATIWRDSGNYDAALEQARAVLVRNPQHVGALAEIGRIHRVRERYDVAELVIRQAIGLEDRAALRNDLGLIQLARGDTQLAFEEFQRAIALDERFAPARLNQASVRMRAGDYAGAAREYEAALAVDPNNLDARVALGAALRGRGEHRQARRQYEQVLEEASEHPAALFNLAILMADFLDERAEAREFFTRFLAVAAPESPFREVAQRYLSEGAAPAE